MRLSELAVSKPRTVFWEWLMLSAESPLRRYLNAAALQDGLGEAAFGFLPNLKFARNHDGGEVERLALAPLTETHAEARRDLARIVGSSLALWTWLGVSDLHWENLALGVDGEGRVIFTPLDLEMMLADLSLPTETKLLPDADPEYAAICQHACGVRRVLPYLGKPIAASDLLTMLVSFRKMAAFLGRHAPGIASVLSDLPEVKSAPLRVLLRGTDEYVFAGKRRVWPPLLEAEAEQLERGDIPYFFRLYGRPGIHYYADPTLSQVRTLPLKGDVPQLEPLLSVSKGLRASSRKKLVEEGPFTIWGAFDHPSLTGKYGNEELEVSVTARRIVFSYPGGEEIQARRDLSSFVSRVYLPCRCGEVTTVFVPPVTRCEA